MAIRALARRGEQHAVAHGFRALVVRGRVVPELPRADAVPQRHRRKQRHLPLVPSANRGDDPARVPAPRCRRDGLGGKNAARHRQRIFVLRIEQGDLRNALRIEQRMGEPQAQVAWSFPGVGSGWSPDRGDRRQPILGNQLFAGRQPRVTRTRLDFILPGQGAELRRLVGQLLSIGERGLRSRDVQDRRHRGCRLRREFVGVGKPAAIPRPHAATGQGKRHDGFIRDTVRMAGLPTDGDVREMIFRRRQFALGSRAGKRACTEQVQCGCGDPGFGCRREHLRQDDVPGDVARGAHGGGRSQWRLDQSAQAIAQTLRPRCLQHLLDGRITLA